MAEAGRHVTCQEVVELVTDYLEGALSAEETSLFEQHINFCDGCVTYVNQIRTTTTTLGRLNGGDVPAETLDGLMAAFRGWKRS